MLDADYIIACERRARRFQGTFDQGTSGSLAADVMRLIRERAQLMQTLEAANETIRAAVVERMANTPEDDPKLVGYKLDQGDPEPNDNYAEWKPAAFNPQMTAVLGTGCEIVELDHSVAVSTLKSAISAVTDRHTKYGPPNEHFSRTASLVNAAFGTSFTAADWALVMVLDKVARQRGPAATNDAAIDIAGYAACHQECRGHG